MTRCEEFYEKVERDGNFCNMDRIAYQRTIEYIGFCREIDVPLGTLSERAARPLIKEKDPIVKAKAIKKIENALNLKKPITAARTERLIKNLEDGKDTRGRPQKESDDIEIVEQVVRKTDVREDIEPDIETVVEDFVDPEEDDVGGVSDIPDMPAQSIGEIVGTGEGTPLEKVLEEEDEEEDIKRDNPEITEKVVKEYLRNAGHEDKVKPERIPTEEDKIRLTEKYVEQMFIWGADSEEIKRRVGKAVVFTSAD
jgi:hypothetical protein